VTRQPVSQQRYAVRRLAVATVLALAVFGAVKGVASLSEKEASGEEPPATVVSDGSTNPVAATAGPTTVAAAPTAPPTTQPERSGPPTSDNPARVLVVGDSDAGTFAPFLEMVVDEWDGVVDIETEYKVSSGLARPDFFNWPARLRELLSTRDPDIIVVTFGGNDAQGLTLENGDVVEGLPTQDPEAWTTEYVSRVNEMLDIMTEDPDRVVIWVGIPNAKEPEFTDRLRVQDQAVRTALEAYPDAIFVDTWSYFDGVNGGIAEYVVDPRDGVAKPVRQSDGFHLNADGAAILAEEIADRIETVLAEMGADL
jgi:hypothetical protein